jgi:hypothetical protein
MSVVLCAYVVYVCFMLLFCCEIVPVLTTTIYSIALYIVHDVAGLASLW